MEKGSTKLVLTEVVTIKKNKKAIIGFKKQSFH
jgi:hypothetical protein